MLCTGLLTEMTMKKRFAFYAVSSALLLMVGGCANFQNTRSTTDDGAALAASMAGPLDELRAVSVEARDELRLLAKTRDAVATASLTFDQHRQKHFQATHVPAGFEKLVTYHFKGEAENAARAIAALAGYSLNFVGHRTRVPVIVSIDIENAPLNEALKELGAQTGDNATVEVYAPTKSMRFVYAGDF